MVPVLIVVGLGNPGSEYENTRHNVGFLVADMLTEALGGRFRAGKGDFLQSTVHVSGKQVTIIKPLTYMNNSGTAVAEVLQESECKPENLLVVSDDVALPLGTLRIRWKGSDGGHNGLASIIYELRTGDFPRLRCGIGQGEAPRKGMMADFVLSPFDRSELPVVREMAGRAAQTIVECASSGIYRTMSKHNT